MEDVFTFQSKGLELVFLCVHKAQDETNIILKKDTTQYGTSFQQEVAVLRHFFLFPI